MQIHLFNLGVGYIEFFDGKQGGALKCELLTASLFDLSLFFFDLLLAVFEKGVLGCAGCAECQRRYDCQKDEDPNEITQEELSKSAEAGAMAINVTKLQH